MIWSVSTSLRSSGTAVPVIVLTGFIASLFAALVQIGRRRENACDRRRGRYGRRHQMRATAFALPSLKVAVAGRRAALAGRELIRVHAEAHRAACGAPL